MKNFEVYQYDTTAAYLVSKHCKCNSCPMDEECDSSPTHEDINECFDRWKEFFDKNPYILKNVNKFAELLKDVIDCDKCPAVNKCGIDSRCKDDFIEWLNEERDDDGNVLYWHKCMKYEEKKENERGGKHGETD